MSSGVVLNDDIHCVTFHGYNDIGYLIRILRGGRDLPESENEFLELVRVFFPNLYDIKYLVNFASNPNLRRGGGLEKIGNVLKVNKLSLMATCLNSDVESCTASASILALLFTIINTPT